MAERLYDVVIIGGGPAGLTAAIYTSRARLGTLLIAGTTWGGQLMLTSQVENFPGFPEGILGPELMGRMLKQAERLGVEIIFEDATSVNFSSRPFKINVGDKSLQAKAVIIATGASTKWLGLENELNLMGRGVSSCAVCDAAFFRDKKAVVVGGGDTAMDEAMALAKHAREVTIVHRRDKLRASKILQEKVFANPKINVVWNTVVVDILGEEKVEGVKLQNVRTGEVSTLPTDAVFVAIGHKPNTDIFKGKLYLDEFGYIIVSEETKTSVEGVFAAGDVKDPKYKQAITSAGSGCQAALDAEKYLQEHPI